MNRNWLILYILLCLAPWQGQGQVLMRLGFAHNQGEALLTGRNYWSPARNTGIFVTRDLERMYLEAGLYYSQMQMLEYGPDSYRQPIRRMHVYGRINIPLLAHYKMGSTGPVKSVYGGLAPGWAILRAHTWRGLDSTGTLEIKSDDLNDSRGLRNFNPEAILGLVFELKIGRENALQLCPNLRYSLIAPFAEGENKGQRLFFAGISLRFVTVLLTRDYSDRQEELPGQRYRYRDEEIIDR